MTLPTSLVSGAAAGAIATATAGGLPRAAAGVGQSAAARARTQAQEFEGVFLNTMFQQMFTGVDGEGPFGGGKGTGVWRSFLTDEYAKSFAAKGGIGLADHVYRALIAQQEARAR